jgi:hypothetical protein
MRPETQVGFYLQRPLAYLILIEIGICRQMLLKVPSTKFHEISFSVSRYTNMNKQINKKTRARARARARRKL